MTLIVDKILEEKGEFSTHTKTIRVDVYNKDLSLWKTLFEKRYSDYESQKDVIQEAEEFIKDLTSESRMVRYEHSIKLEVLE